MTHASPVHSEPPPTQKQKHAPGPTNKRLTTQALEEDPLSFLLEMTQRYGDVVRLPLTFGTTYLINHPDGVRYVLQEHAANYGKEPHENAIFKRFVGLSVLTAEGDFWLRLRRLEQPAFGRQHVAQACGQMVEAIRAYLDEGLPAGGSGEVVDMVPAMKALTLRVLGKTIFSLDLGNDASVIGAAMQAINTSALDLFYHPFLPYFGPLAASNRRRAAAQRVLDAVVFKAIHERRAQLTNQLSHPEDSLTYLLQLRDEEGKPAFTDSQIRNETLSLLIAGHDNASSLLCWTWYLLAQHPNAAARLYQEIAETVGDRAPSFNDLDRLPYTRMVLEEALRLYPPAWSFPRRVISDDVIGGYGIPAGSTALLSPYTTQRHAAFWRDPEVFDPERFSEAEQAARPRYAHFPFGGGQHQCMGAIYAMIEAQFIVIMMAQRYRLECLPGFKPVPEPLVTLRPQELPMRVVQPHLSSAAMSLGD
jgi:cytochrome P450